ncbi:hypothetical protein [Roseivirga misakiensis]|uniref:DoxX family protein n=1 Tax=Roseivirga misakiensis TaxID=1563681 RepID=A0A1E5T505_9BACT|nr:hypothetical protein [Roseivirga misakiensis]OEK06441.1 hypothetical protein BFP71_01830 [Roseivirga misakiensis]
MESNIAIQEEWSIFRKIGFRFIYLFFALIILPFPFTTPLYLLDSYWLGQAFADFWSWTTQFVGSNILGIEGFSNPVTGSGDKTYDWVQKLSVLGISVIGTIIWSAVDKRRKNYYRVWRWFVLLVVFYLVYYMFFYGFIKVYWLQMPAPRIDRLLKTYGQSSPMGLLWTFMGASKTYSVYAGLSEVIAGTLLLFRRTRTLGGMVTFGVMFNVFMLNLAYDVPVKLFSAQLMIMGLYIAMIDRKAIFGLLLFQKAVNPTPWPPMFKTPVKNYILLLIQGLLVFQFVQSNVKRGVNGRTSYGELRPKSALYGLYDVEDFIKNGDTIPPLLTDKERWQRVIFDAPGSTRAIFMNDRSRYFNSKIDTVASTVTFTIGRDSLSKDYLMEYRKVADGLVMEGILEQDTLRLKLKTYDLKKFYLTNRDFHWVSERPWHVYDTLPKPNW